MNNTRIYVGNLSFTTTEDALRALFEASGRLVQSVAIASDRATGRSRGFGFVEMHSSEDALHARSALDGAELDGRRLQVEEARERSTQDTAAPRNA